jgi:hypothetical protein
LHSLFHLLQTVLGPFGLAAQADLLGIEGLQPGRSGGFLLIEGLQAALALGELLVER